MSETNVKNRSMISATIDFEAEGVQLGALKVPHSVHRSAYGHIAIPVAVAKNGKGPTVLLTGGVHGDEYEGPIALSKLVNKIVPSDVSGRIIIIPALNYPAFLAASRVSPIDGISPDELHIKELIKRIDEDKVKEVIISLSFIEVIFNIIIIKFIPGAFISFNLSYKGFISSRSRCFNIKGLIYFYRSYSIEYVYIRAF